MPASPPYRGETLALHGGSHRADPATGAVAPPIYFTTSYQFKSAEQARRVFALEELGYTYTRTINPSREVLERRLSALEGGWAALAVATGAAAVLYAILNLAEAGDNVVVSTDSASDRLAGTIVALSRLGISVRTAPATAEAFVQASDDATRAWLAESLPVPNLAPFPTADVARAGRAIGIPLLIDNTAQPLTAKPLHDGAAIVIYSAAEYLSGHGTTDGGVIIDSNTFSWERHRQRFTTLTTPDPCYHGTIWTEVVKQWNASAFIARTRARYLRDFGAAISPMDVFHLIQGIETLALRMPQHTANARYLTHFLSHHPHVRDVVGGNGGLITFSLNTPEKAASALKALTWIRPAAHFGGAISTLAPIPRIPGRLLFSVGLEHPEDLENDLLAALNSP